MLHDTGEGTQENCGTGAEREISYICGLGAKVGCEWLSEHSTCSDESHKYSLFLFLEASPLLHKSKFFLYFLENMVRIKSYMFKYMMMLNLEVNK